MTLDEYTALPWVPVEEILEDGTLRLTVMGLPDFEVFGDTRESVQGEWPIALRSHLQGYLAAGKAVPIPSPRFYLPDPLDLETTSGFTAPAIFLDERGQIKDSAETQAA